jgi:hypothetical protein
MDNRCGHIICAGHDGCLWNVARNASGHTEACDRTQHADDCVCNAREIVATGGRVEP